MAGSSFPGPRCGSRYAPPALLIYLAAVVLIATRLAGALR